MKIEQDTLFTCYELSEKEKKNLAILELIRKKDLISRTEISKDTKLNIVSVSNYITSFIDKNLLSEKGLDVSSGGRKPELVELNKKSNYVIGVELGEKYIKAALSDIGFKIVKKEESAISSKKESQDRLLELLESLMKKSGIAVDDIKSIGIASGDGDTAAGKAVVKKIGITTFAANSAMAAAFGEKRLNPEADTESLLYIYSDRGSGVFIKNEMCFGKESKYLLPWNEALSIASFAVREVNRGVGTKIVNLAKGDTKNITSDIVIEAAKDGDRVALDIVETVGINLGIRIAYLVNLFNPQTVVLGGNIVKAGEIALKAVKNMVKKLSLRSGSGVKVMPSMLGEDCVSSGAVALTIREIFLKA